MIPQFFPYCEETKIKHSWHGSLRVNDHKKKPATYGGADRMSQRIVCGEYKDEPRQKEIEIEIEIEREK